MLLTLTLLLLVIVWLLLKVELTWLVEPGPVLLIEPPLPVVELLPDIEPEPLFVTCTLVLLPAWLLASPVLALPPKVLPSLLALPLFADCELLLLKLIELLLVMRCVLL